MYLVVPLHPDLSLCPSMLGMTCTCTTWSLALERSFRHLESNCSSTLQLYFSLTFYTIKCLVMFSKIMTTLRKSPVVSHNDVFCLFLFDEVLIRGKIPLIICLFWKIILALDWSLSIYKGCFVNKIHVFNDSNSWVSKFIPKEGQNSWLSEESLCFNIVQWSRLSSASVIVFIIFLNLQGNFNNMNDDPREKFVIRARGFAWSATTESVAKLFSGKSYKIFSN